MKLSKVFALAKDRIWDGKGNMYAGGDTSPYICDNLGYLQVEGEISEADKDRARLVIRKLLDYRFSFEYWLLEQGVRKEWIKACAKAGLTPSKEIERWNIKLQTTRRAWLEHLSQHYAAQGD